MYKKFMKTSQSMIRQTLLQFYSLLWTPVHSQRIQNKNYVFLKRINHSGFSTNWLAPKVKHDVQCGRSMIEMLGVLAIVGVLSVGGIAGYSKAMEKYKVNKLINDYNNLIVGLLEYNQNMQKYIGGGEPPLTDTIIALNLAPNNWKKINKAYLQDSFGNYINVRYRSPKYSDRPEENTGVIIDFLFGGINVDASGHVSSDNFNEKVCFETYKNIVQPLHDTLKHTSLCCAKSNNTLYYGDKYCGGRKQCLHTMPVTKMKDICASCNRKERCNLTIIF